MDKVITMNSRSIRDNKVDMNLYSFIELCMQSGMPFTVCNVCEDEFKKMEDELKHCGILDERMANPKFHEYDSCRWMITRDTDITKILFADYNNPKQRGTYSFDFETLDLQYYKDGLQFTEYYNLRLFKYGYINGLKIYTTETYDDVIKHYQDEIKRKNDIKTEQEIIDADRISRARIKKRSKYNKII